MKATDWRANSLWILVHVCCPLVWQWSLALCEDLFCSPEASFVEKRDRITAINLLIFRNTTPFCRPPLTTSAYLASPKDRDNTCFPRLISFCLSVKTTRTTPKSDLPEDRPDRKLDLGPLRGGSSPKSLVILSVSRQTRSTSRFGKQTTNHQLHRQEGKGFLIIVSVQVSPLLPFGPEWGLIQFLYWRANID